MSLSARIRHTTNILSTPKYSSRKQKTISSQRHYCDYYTFKDAPKNKKTKKTGKGRKQEKEKKVGSVYEHGQSLQKLQLVIDNRNQDIVKLMKETSSLQAQNKLLKLNLMRPRNEEEKELLTELNRLKEELQRLKKEGLEMERKEEKKIKKLQKERDRQENNLNELKKRGRRK